MQTPSDVHRFMKANGFNSMAQRSTYFRTDDRGFVEIKASRSGKSWLVRLADGDYSWTGPRAEDARAAYMAAELLNWGR